MPVAAATTVFIWLFDRRRGVVNYLLDAIPGVDMNRYDWLGNPLTLFFVASVLIIWMSVPFVSFAIYAGLTQISEEVMEAAQIDGAGAWQRFRRIILPMVRPVLSIVLLLQLIWDLRVFAQITLLKDAGIDPETFQPKSWAELLDAARAIKKANPDSYPLQLNAGVNMGEATTMQGYYMAILGTGESVVDENGKYIVASQGILDTLNLYKTIYVDEQLGDQRAQLLADGRNRSFANFRDGVTALLLEGDYFYRSVTPEGSEFAVANRDEVMGWAKMPAKEPGAGIRGQDFVTISGGTGFVLNPATDTPKEAWALLSFMNEVEMQNAFQAIQPRITARTDVEIPNSPFLTDVSQTLLPLTTARPNDENYNAVSAEIQRMTEAVVSGELSPEDAMAQFKTSVIGIVGEENTVSLL